MLEPLTIAKVNGENLGILPGLLNRHGIITGATGTGKTVTLQKMAESFSKIGIPVFAADVKGDMSGIGIEGELTPKLQSILEGIGVTDWAPGKSPITFWDVFGEKGHPIRTTIEELGPLLLSRLLNLTAVQEGILQIIFKIAENKNLPLIDLKDLQVMSQYVGENASQFRTQYGNITTASIGAIQRGLLTLEQEGAELFLGEPVLDIFDFMRADSSGRGMINILSAEKLYNQPKLYAIFLLWLLTELFDRMPEVGDLEKPKLVFFFDEAHLLFTNAPQALQDKIEHLVRLIRSKGVGVYFVTQNPMDIPDKVLGQLGNRVQHALRAFTPRDQKAVRVAAETMRANPDFKTEEAITELGVGEALISFLDEKGRPMITERANVIAPDSRMGILADSEYTQIFNSSSLYGKYETKRNRESAFEKLSTIRASEEAELAKKNKTKENDGGIVGTVKDAVFGSTGPRGGKRDGIAQMAYKSFVRKVINQVLNSILRGKR